MRAAASAWKVGFASRVVMKSPSSCRTSVSCELRRQQRSRNAYESRLEGTNTSAVSMLKSLDWAKAIAEKRAALITSLDCIFAVGSIGDRGREELWRCGKSGKRTTKDEKQTRRMQIETTQEQRWRSFRLWKVWLRRLCGRRRMGFVEW